MVKAMQTAVTVAKPAGSAAAGGGLGFVLVWLWNMNMPDQQMNGEVGAAVGGFVGGYFAPILDAAQTWVLGKLSK